jgi:MFS family permease
MTMLVFVTIGLLMISTQNLIMFYASLPFLGTSQAILRVIITNKAVSTIDARKKGEVIGTITAIMTGAMVIAPVVAGILFEYSASLPFFVSAAMSIIALFISRKFGKT